MKNKMESKKDREIEEDFAKVSELNYRPVEDDETEKVLKVVSKGATWGALSGFLIAQLPSNYNFLFGYYLSDSGLVLLGYVGVGLVIGALGGWLYTVVLRQR